MTTGSYVQLIPWIELDMKHIKAVYTKILLQTNVHDIKEDTENYEDVFLITTIEGQVIKRVILCGPVGAGKSTILRKIAYDWAVGSVEVLRKFTLLFVLKMSTVKESSNLIDLVFLQLLAHDTAVDKADLNTFIHDKESSSGVLILLDGFDEFQATNIDPSKFGSVLKMLNRKVGQDWFVVVTTRPSCLDDLTSKLLVQHPFVHVSVLGFRPEDVNQYVLRFYSDNLVTAEKLLDRIRSSIVLSDLTKIPMLLLLMCLLWREGAQLPDTLSRLFDEAMGFIFRRKMPHLSKEAASDVAAEIARAVGKTAIQGLLLPEQRHSFQEREFERSVLDRAIQAGVLKSQRVIKSLDMQSIVQFIDKTFQEYCAGKYYQCLQDREFREIHNKIDDPCAFGNLLRFCCGDNEQCAERVLNTVFKKLWTPTEAELALNCYFESQSTSLLSVDFIEAFVARNMVVDYNTHDSLNSFLWFLRHIGSGYLSRIHSLTVARSSLPKFSEVFASHLADMNQLKSLGLTSCHINAQDLIAIATSASELANLTDLDLSHNKGLGGHAKTWVAGLKSMKSLKKLKMRNCGIQYEDLIHLVETVSDMGNLMHCDFSLGKWVEFNVLPRGNSIHANIRASSLTDEDMANILKSLSNRKDLASLTVHGVHGVSGWASLWIPLLQNLTNLEKLILNSCSLESKDIEYLAEALSQMVSLTELSLEGNTSLGGFAKSWAPDLNLMVHLARLSFGWCDLKFTDIKHLVATLSKTPSLKDLSLRGNWALGGFAEAWAPCLEEMVHVVYLDMGWCELKRTDMKHLVAALNRMPTLQNLSLKGNQNLGKALQKHSATGLNQLKCSVCLDMSL
ncbi:NLR family CARD domain-containing protein 4-like [Acanthaster planci]|uniref:NLR family CARD domain-containing protein 4-like n=1 Tax=Acanthaster planci TaxID=133434 RepID=A0A8B8A2B5_ACAPL|nr:NLR family CARD domain-containing protein 4-like [Acanthaster planci]